MVDDDGRRRRHDCLYFLSRNFSTCEKISSTVPSATICVTNTSRRTKFQTVRTTKWNWNTTISKQFGNCFVFGHNKTPRPWNALAVLDNHCPYLLFARQTTGGEGAWRRRSQCWVAARYCKTLLCGVTSRVTRYILPKVTPSVTGYFFTETKVTHNDVRVVDWSLIDSFIDSWYWLRLAKTAKT